MGLPVPAGTPVAKLHVAVIKADTPDKIPTSPVDGKPTLVYWDICGLAAPIRLALATAGVDFVDVRVDCGPLGDAYKSMWFGFKPNLELVLGFPNLPYLLDGDVALSQSNAILRYIGRKHGLTGESASLHIVDMVLDQMSDFDHEITGRCYGDFPALRPFCAEELPAMLSQWARLLGSKSFLTGDELTVADLKLYETLRKLIIIEAEIGTATLHSFPSLLAFVQRVEATPALKEYMASGAFLARPLNNAHAQFK